MSIPRDDGFMWGIIHRAIAGEFNRHAFWIDAEATIATWAADGTLGRIWRDECEAAWVDIGGES